MKIAVYIEGKSIEGGGFTHQLNMLNLVSQKAGNEHEFLAFCMSLESLRAAQSMNLSAVLVKQGLWGRLKRYLSRQRWTYKVNAMPLLSRIVQSPMESVFTEHDVDLVYFPGPSATALELSQHNYIFSVWDLCHLEHPEFPEVKLNREFERREDLYRRATRKAVAVIVDSRFGERLLAHKYQLEPDRTVAVPFLPSLFTRDFTPDHNLRTAIFSKYKIQPPYIFYPAQFWAHKNHVYLIKALQILRDELGIEIQAVFSGVDKGNRQHVLDKASELGVADLINCIGFAENGEMPYLYEGALALTMPTYFGPTNIPPLDAFALGCPVCYSDLPAFRAQAEDAAFFMDLNEPISLVEIIEELHKWPECTEEKIKRGRQYIEQWSEQHCWERLNTLFTQYEQKQVCWK